MVIDLEQARAAGISERRFAAATRVPRTSLRHWDARKRQASAAGVPSFFETAEGIAWLHRLFWAAVFVMTLRCPAGIRAICELFELAGLDKTLATSFGSIQKMAVRLQHAVIDASEQERQALVDKLCEDGGKEITICQDETFHPAPLLVAQEPVSGMILAEQYVQRRDARTWGAVMDEALMKLPVRVVQSTTDQGRALLKHGRDNLNAHHSPDLFHVLRDLHKATSRPLVQRQKAAHARLAETTRARQAVAAKRRAWLKQKRRPGRPPDFDGRMRRARDVERVARTEAAAADADRVAMRAAINRIAEVYHPFDLTNGEHRTADEVAERIGECFAEIDDIGRRTPMPERSLEQIEKAWRVVDAMNETIGWTHANIATRLDTLGLSPELHAEVSERVLPAMYIERVAGRAQVPQIRRDLQRTAKVLHGRCTLMDGLDAEQRSRLARAVQDAADLFQRSSSCVEGRNSHLALFHAGCHRLTVRKLKALTCVHNFHATRGDGTTAAQRFFGHDHKPLFETLVAVLPSPSRPAAKRRRVKPAQTMARAA